MTLCETPLHLPVQRGNMRISNPGLINVVLHVMENGFRWRALPERFESRLAVCARRRRARSGALGQLFAALRERHLVDEDAESPGLDNASVTVNSWKLMDPDLP